MATHNDLATQSGWVGGVERLTALGSASVLTHYPALGELDILKRRLVDSMVEEDDATA